MQFLAKKTPIISYWQLVFIFCILSQITVSTFLASACVISWAFFCRWRIAIMMPIVATAFLAIYIAMLLSIYGIWQLPISPEIISSAVGMVTLFIVLIQSYRLFAFDPEIVNYEKSVDCCC